MSVRRKPAESARKSLWGNIDLAPTEAEAWERARKWAEEHASSITSYNLLIEEHGVFGEDLRPW